MSILAFTPHFTEKEVRGFAETFFGIQGSVKPLPSERDQNYLLQAPTGETYVLKIANSNEDRSMLEAQNQAMEHLVDRVPVCPRVIPAKNGKPVSRVQADTHTTHFLRLVSYLPGIPMGKLKRRSAELFRDLGQRMGQMDRALSTFEHPALHRDFHWDLANALTVVQSYKSLVTDSGLLAVIEKCSCRFETTAVFQLEKLRKSVIHNDANDYNVIVGGGNDRYTRNQSVTGIIDFGDMVYSYTVADLAITIAYAVLDSGDPLRIAAEIVKGFHREYPLTGIEISVLFDLVCMRLCASACLAAYQQSQRPDDAYLSISQQPIRRTLPKLADIRPAFAEAAFRNACGLAPLPGKKKVTAWVKANHTTFAPLLGKRLDEKTCVVFDLGVGSPFISGDPSSSAQNTIASAIIDQMDAAGVQYGIGRYDEARLYQTSFSEDDRHSVAGIRRSVHLCMDLLAPPGTPVFAPLAGSVYALGEKTAAPNQGPVVIVKHQPAEDISFFTLYGHLSKTSIENLKIGRTIAKGERLAAIAPTTENGGWPPQLRFQLITDLLDRDVDFPCACYPDLRDVWVHFSLDPNLLLQIPKKSFPPSPPSKSETLSTRRKHISPNLSIGYKNPVKVIRGWRQFLFDETGRQYLDAYNNVPHVGHCHPAVIKAGLDQMNRLNTNTRYLHDTINRYAEKLLSTLPDQLEVCFFLNSASEANELAIRLAKAHTGRKDFIVLEGAYHGNTNTLIDISPYKHGGPGGEGAPDWVHTAPLADVYRGPYKKDDPLAGPKYAQHVQEIIVNLNQKGKGPAGYIAESYPSVGGQIIFPPDYLKTVYDFIRQAGGVCIADEVQTGYGRIGTHFYAFEAQKAVPDIVVLGKPIGNGHPIGVLATTRAIAESFVSGMEFFSTFGGNTVSCAIGLKVLEITLEEKLQENALRVGTYLLDRLQRLKDRYEIVGDVRGSGLFIGMELVRDRNSLEPAADEALFIADRMRDKGILLGTDGPRHNVVKIRPPLVITQQDARKIADTLEEILAEDFEQI